MHTRKSKNGCEVIMLLRSPPRMTNRSVLLKYIESDLWTWLKELSTAFLKINFQDNFQSFIATDISIPANKEVAVQNQFKNRYPGLIPEGRIIVRQSGKAVVVDGDTPWTADLCFLQNASNVDTKVSVLFFK